MKLKFTGNNKRTWTLCDVFLTYSMLSMKKEDTFHKSVQRCCLLVTVKKNQKSHEVGKKEVTSPLLHLHILHTHTQETIQILPKLEAFQSTFLRSSLFTRNAGERQHSSSWTGKSRQKHTQPRTVHSRRLSEADLAKTGRRRKSETSRQEKKLWLVSTHTRILSGVEGGIKIRLTGLKLWRKHLQGVTLDEEQRHHQQGKISEVIFLSFFQVLHVKTM